MQTDHQDSKDRKPHSALVGPGIVQAHQRVAPVHLARRLSQILLSVVAEVVPEDLGRNRMGVLVAVSQTPGLDQKRLAAMMAIDASSIGQAIDAIEEKRLVRRVVSPSDRRINIVELTAAGRKFVEAHRPKILAAQYEALSVLSESERRTLLDLMARVIEANPQHDRPGGGRRPPKPSA